MIELKEEHKAQAQELSGEIQNILARIYEKRHQKDQKEWTQFVDTERFMSDHDKWMIGKPADDACYEYLEKAVAQRRAYSFGTLVLFSIKLPFPINIAYLIGVLFARFFKKTI